LLLLLKISLSTLTEVGRVLVIVEEGVLFDEFFRDVHESKFRD
jgi:hypothetical protein